MTNRYSFMAQSLLSVANLPFPRAFVRNLSFCFGKGANAPDGAQRSYKKPTVGVKNRVQMPHPRTTRKLYFPVNKLQIPFLWEISNNLG